MFTRDILFNIFLHTDTGIFAGLLLGEYGKWAKEIVTSNVFVNTKFANDYKVDISDYEFNIDDLIQLHIDLGTKFVELTAIYHITKGNYKSYCNLIQVVEYNNQQINKLYRYTLNNRNINYLLVLLKRYPDELVAPMDSDTRKDIARLAISANNCELLDTVFPKGIRPNIGVWVYLQNRKACGTEILKHILSFTNFKMVPSQLDNKIRDLLMTDSRMTEINMMFDSKLEYILLNFTFLCWAVECGYFNIVDRLLTKIVVSEADMDILLGRAKPHSKVCTLLKMQ